MRVGEIERGLITRREQQVRAGAQVAHGVRPATIQTALVIVAKTEGCFPVAVLHAEENLGVERRGREPREPRAEIAQAIAAQEAGVHEREIDEAPRVRVLGVEAAKVREELARAQLQIAGQRTRLGVCLLDLQCRSTARIDLVNKTRLTAEIRIDRAAENRFEILQREAALLRIVAAGLQFIEVGRGRGTGGQQHVEREIEKRRAALDAQRVGGGPRFRRDGWGGNRRRRPYRDWRGGQRGHGWRRGGRGGGFRRLEGFNLTRKRVQLLALQLLLLLELRLQLLELTLQGFDFTDFLADGDLRPQPDDARSAGQRFDLHNFSRFFCPISGSWAACHG